MRRSRGPWFEQLALFVLLAGSLVAVGWLVGVVLVWLSRRWTVRDKLIATLCPPGGFAPAIWIVLGGGGATCSGSSTPGGATVEHCTGGPSPAVQTLLIVAAVVLAIMPIVTAVYLNRRISGRPRPQQSPRTSTAAG
jgi:hypothetical protein